VKLPKTVTIAGREWRIIQDKKMRGGTFDAGKCEIVIGIKYPKDIPDVFLHEILEAILLERNCRYSLFEKYSNDGYLFVMQHKEFDNVGRDLALALKDVMR